MVLLLKVCFYPNTKRDNNLLKRSELISNLLLRRKMINKISNQTKRITNTKSHKHQTHNLTYLPYKKDSLGKIRLIKSSSQDKINKKN